ncbi:MAG: hypothetical protein FWF57_04425 [Defluviitaleaceae bacterium]|nr:hypothetical protein [Defluviitaleaceae bacterium]
MDRLGFFKRVQIPISGLALGLVALGNLLRPFGENLRYGIGILSFFIICLFLIKLIVDFKFVLHDLKSPVMHSVTPTATMTIMLLSTYIRTYLPQFSLIIWYIAVCMHIIIMLAFIIKYLSFFKLRTVFSSWWLIGVGLVVISVTAPAMGVISLGKIAFWIGFVGYFFVLVLALARGIKLPVLLEPARPTIAITAAPMSLLIVGYFSSFDNRPFGFIMFMFVISFLSYIFVIYKLFSLLKIRFYPSYSAFTFPMVISAIAFRLINNFLISNDIRFFTPIYQISMFIATGLVFYVLIRYFIDLFKPAKFIYKGFKTEELKEIIEKDIKPFVTQVDNKAEYRPEIIIKLAKLGFFNSNSINETEVVLREADLIEQVAKVCATTAFNIWGHITAINAVRCGNSEYLKKEILPKMENGEILGGPGLSTPMKSMVGFTDLTVTTKKTEGGYILNGYVPQVSNCGKTHRFSIIAKTEDGKMVACLANAADETVEIKEQVNFIGMNGSSTFSCHFNNTFLSDENVLATSDKLDIFVARCRATTVFNQVPLALGLISTSIENMNNLSENKKMVNMYLEKHLNVNSKKLKKEYNNIKKHFVYYLGTLDRPSEFRRLVAIRLQAFYTANKAITTYFLCQGGSSYLKNSSVERNLREAYFLGIVTPSVAHLETILSF